MKESLAGVSAERKALALELVRAQREKEQAEQRLAESKQRVRCGNTATCCTKKCITAYLKYSPPNQQGKRSEEDGARAMAARLDLLRQSNAELAAKLRAEKGRRTKEQEESRALSHRLQHERHTATTARKERAALEVRIEALEKDLSRQRVALAVSCLGYPLRCIASTQA